MARDTFCFQGLSLRMPMPKPERKNSSPVVTRSHFCEASNSSTAESQMKACSLLWGSGKGKEEEEGVGRRQGGRRRGRRGLRCNSTMIYIHICGSHPSLSLAHQIVCVIQRLPAISTAAYVPNEIQCQMGEGASPIGFPPSQRCSSWYNLKKGAPGLSVSSTSHWFQCCRHICACCCPWVPVSVGPMGLNQRESYSKSCHFPLVQRSRSPTFPKLTGLALVCFCPYRSGSRPTVLVGPAWPRLTCHARPG